MSNIWTIYFWVHMVKYDVDQEIMVTYENLWIAWSQFLTNLLIFIYILSDVKIFLVYQYSDLTCSINRNRYLVPIKYLINLNSHLNFEFKGNRKFTAVTYLGKASADSNIEISVCTQKELGWDKIWTWLYYIMGLLDFHGTNKNFICCL